MFRLLRCIGFLALLAMSSSVLALDNDKYYVVDHVYSWTDGYAHIWLEDSGRHDCADQTYPDRYLMRPVVPGFEQKFSVLLAAKVSGQKVKLRYVCENDKPYIEAVRF